ncbi:hypothetical protein AAGT95_10245 [Salinicola lusitanus]|uniref:Uncharacterized protein n=1 Tax=Salinicola lusitanus TaxID=1949085 RepID=A0ABZ3CZ70_9GAMM
MEMESSSWIGALGLVISILAVSVSYRLGRRSELGLAVWTQELRAWSGDVVKALTAARYALANSTGTTRIDISHAQSLSALIDIGRLYLPNQNADKHGVEKPPAYRGDRHSALDPLVASVRLLEAELEDHAGEARVLWELQREFVSRVSDILEPRLHNQAIARLLRRGYVDRKRDPSAGGLLPQKLKRPMGATAALAVARERARCSDY